MAFSLLGCPHNHLSFPMLIAEPLPPAPPNSPPAPLPDSTAMAHVTCLDCGREFWYDWVRMRRLGARPLPVYSPRRAA